ncbi:hypothetical protein NECAME_11964 [Necator americanus]|uniref:Uncharacterized protein n=1 Tax=Necator americanus TaxID=51031 RepID=W2T502_NECAM|nr:hypothetical protein NECAME_11964 [Necator americanus]ETN76047.1 hypothetical protein NECAME_11964 [Necator americanus]
MTSAVNFDKVKAATQVVSGVIRTLRTLKGDAKPLGIPTLVERVERLWGWPLQQPYHGTVEQTQHPDWSLFAGYLEAQPIRKLVQRAAVTSNSVGLPPKLEFTELVVAYGNWI